MSTKKPKKAKLDDWTFEPIGLVRSVYKEKFGIPRQSGLATQARGVIELQPHPFLEQACDKLDTFSHIWVIFVFHRHDAKAWKPRIRPPRLGGVKKVGVLASRSPHRPNPIGLSVVRLDRIERLPGSVVHLHVSGLDILDETPVLDVKPYIPYADIVADASSGWAVGPLPQNTVVFTERAEQDIETLKETLEMPHLKKLILETLVNDPRPASQQKRYPADAPESQGLSFGFALEGYDVKWEIRDGTFRVTAVVPMSESIK